MSSMPPADCIMVVAREVASNQILGGPDRQEIARYRGILFSSVHPSNSMGPSGVFPGSCQNQLTPTLIVRL